MARKEVLRFEELHVGYGTKEVLKGFTASIRQGEFVGLIGINGTGKSTLINCISGLLPVRSGKIFINGKDNITLSQRERAKLVAVVPQSFGIDYDFYTEDIVMMGRNPYLRFRDNESEKDWQIVNEAMCMTHTDQFKGRLFNALSGGEKQRIIIARAIAQQTDIILLDEPTSALDVHHQIEVMELIVKLNQTRQKTVLAVLHDLNLAARYCDRLIMIDEGIVADEGSPAEVITDRNMQSLYNMKMLIRNNPIFEKPEVIPIRVLNRHQVANPKKIHIICGGDGAVHLMDELAAIGHQLTAGVLPKHSDDWVMGKHLGIEMIEIPPFTGVGSKDQEKNLNLMAKSELLFVADVPFGNGNIENLRGIENYEGQIVFHRSALINDFTKNHEVSEIANQLAEQKKAVIVEDNDGFLRWLRKDV